MKKHADDVLCFTDRITKLEPLDISRTQLHSALSSQAMLGYLKDKKDASFFLSISGLMNSCSVLDLDAFERNTKAEGLGVGKYVYYAQKHLQFDITIT